MMTLPYGRHEITDDDIAAVVRVLKSDFLTQGPVIAEFEKALASFLGAKHVVAVCNGTAALHLAALALRVQPGDRVLCTPNTFVASANCIRYCGGDVDFVDIDPGNHCIDLEKLERVLKANPGLYKGIVAVDFAGYPMDFERLSEIAKRYSLWLIEDACHALGAEFRDSGGRWVHAGNGQFADLAVFSFHPVKHIAMGEGGAVVTNDDSLAQRLTLLRTHGITKNPSEVQYPDRGWYMEMKELGFNYRLPDMNAALGLSQLSRLPENLKRRREIATMYDRAFQPHGWVKLGANEGKRHAYHLYVLQVPNRQALYDYLKTKGIFSQVHYIPVCDQPYYRERYGVVEVPQARQYYEQALSLPMYPGLSDEDVRYVTECVLGFYKKG